MFMLSTRHATQQRPLAAQRSAAAAQFVTRSQLMEASEWRLSQAATSGIPEEELIADRLFGSTRLYAHWQAEHDGILARVVNKFRSRTRDAALVSAALGLIHRKAFFEYLLAARLRGNDRIEFVRRFFGHEDYKRTIVVEHGNYLRSAASFLCVHHLGTSLLNNPLFNEPLLQYEELYGNYFFAASETLLEDQRNLLFGYTGTLAKSLKRQVELRRTILLRSAVTGTPVENAEASTPRWH